MRKFGPESSSDRTTRDSGYAMVVVLGIISVLTVITFGGFAMSMQALHESDISRQESLGFQAANAAFDAGVMRLRISGFREDSDDWPMYFTAGQIGSGAATVTVTEGGVHDFMVVAQGMGSDGSTETVRARIYVMDIYGMNIAYGSGFNQSAGGKFNGNASVYGPFYTFDDLRQGENLGNAMSGGFGWGPIYIQGGTLDVKAGYLRDVELLYVDPRQAPPRVVEAGTRVIRSVPRMDVPRVDAAYLANAYQQATSQSTDNRQGDPVVRETAYNSEPNPYPSAFLAPGARVDRYKVVDNDDTVNASRSTALVIGGATAFGRADDDFRWNPSDRTLTVWGTVFVDGPVDFTGGLIRYYGNGTIVANGHVRFINSDFVPFNGLGVADKPGHPSHGLPNQTFRDDQVVGIATPRTIRLSNSSGGNPQNPSDPPTHAGAFFADEEIIIESKVMMVGSVISRGISVSGNNNMDLRTSPNLGEVISRAMPGHGMAVVSMGSWARQ